MFKAVSFLSIWNRKGLCVIGALALAWAWPTVAKAEPIAIIVNQTNPVSSLSQSTVASMYRGEELHWPHGGRIKLVNREIGSPLRAEFYQKVLNAKPNQKFYRPGTPITVPSLIQRSDEAVLRFVASIPGAIGYVRLSKVNESVKIVLVIPDQ